MSNIAQIASNSQGALQKKCIRLGQQKISNLAQVLGSALQTSLTHFTISALWKSEGETYCHLQLQNQAKHDKYKKIENHSAALQKTSDDPLHNIQRNQIAIKPSRQNPKTNKQLTNCVKIEQEWIHNKKYEPSHYQKTRLNQQFPINHMQQLIYKKSQVCDEHLNEQQFKGKKILLDQQIKDVSGIAILPSEFLSPQEIQIMRQMIITRKVQDWKKCRRLQNAKNSIIIQLRNLKY